MIRLALMLWLIGLLAAPAPSAAQELGRLFFTPEQRAALDARRKARIPDKPAAVVVESPTTRVDGYVQRSGGRSTVWVNGEPTPEGAQPDGMRLNPARNDPSRFSVSIGERERPFELKIGQKLDRGTGEVRDPIGDGEIRIKRPGAAPR
ncbi:MAG: hypothetical protein ACREUO_11680 [Burkholderiales bacterium]